MSVVRRHQPSAPSHRSQNAAKMPQKTDPGTRAPFRVQPNAAPLKQALGGSGWVSRNRALIPTAVAAWAREVIRSGIEQSPATMIQNNKD